jgi:hypothetical protein
MASEMHKCVIIGLFGPGSRTVVEVPQTQVVHTLAVAKQQRDKLADKVKLGTKKALTI